jgi:hypothetical protein
VGSATRKARGDLRRRQAAEQPQRQRHARGGRQRRVRAGEDQPQAVVAHRPLLLRLVADMREHGRGVPVGAGRLAAEAVDRAAPRGEDDPALRTGREPGPRPALHGDGERVLDRLLGDVDVAEDADEDGHRAAVLGAEDTLDLRRGRHRGRQ